MLQDGEVLDVMKNVTREPMDLDVHRFVVVKMAPYVITSVEHAYVLPDGEGSSVVRRVQKDFMVTIVKRHVSATTKRNVAILTEVVGVLLGGWVKSAKNPVRKEHMVKIVVMSAYVIIMGLVIPSVEPVYVPQAGRGQLVRRDAHQLFMELTVCTDVSV